MSALPQLARDSLYASLIYIAPRVANVLVFIAIGRLSGPAEAGVFALALTYLLIFTTFLRGLDDLTVRQVARQPEQAAAYLGRFSLLRLALAGALYLAFLPILYFALAYSLQAKTTVAILTASMIPDGLSFVVQSVLIGRRRFGGPALILLAATLLKTLAGIWLALSGAGLAAVAWAWLGGSLLGMLAIYALALLTLERPPHGQAVPAGGLSFEAAHWPFLFITILTTIEAQADMVFVSLYQGEAAAGWYNAATTLAFTFALIAQAFRLSIYPLMARYARQAPEKLERLHDEAVRYLGMIALPIAAGLGLLAPQIVALVYGAGFAPAAQVLPFLLPVLVLMFLNVPNARLMLVSEKQGWLLAFLFSSAAINLLMNWLLVPVYGIQGAGAARLASGIVSFLLAYAYVHNRLIRFNLPALLWRPFVAVLGMSLVVWVLREASLALSIPAGAAAYAAGLLLTGALTPAERAAIRQAVWPERKDAPRPPSDGAGLP